MAERGTGSAEPGLTGPEEAGEIQKTEPGPSFVRNPEMFTMAVGSTARVPSFAASEIDTSWLAKPPPTIRSCSAPEGGASSSFPAASWTRSSRTSAPSLLVHSI
jgi:hypothetical protein